MATLNDGIPVFAPVAGATALAANQVTLQAKLILNLEGRWRDIPLASGAVADAPGWSMVWNKAAAGNPPEVYWTTTGASAEVLFPIFVRDGEYITDAQMYIWSDNATNPTNGTIEIYSSKNDGTAGAGLITDFGTGANFWDTNGNTALESAAAINTAFDTTLNNYYVGVQGPTAAVTESRIYSISVKTRFHEGV